MRPNFTLFALALAGITACSSKNPGTGSIGAGGEGGACSMIPQPMFDLTITAAHGPLPRSTTVDVWWSGGQEPTFSLDQPSTWKTIDDQVNLICDVDPMQPPPDMLAALVCHLWTTGPTDVVVKAKGYTPREETYVPPYSDHCQAFVPTAVSLQLELVPEDDAGAD